jgi:hypothetical protein
MRQILLAGFLLLSMVSFGQITITKSDMPGARDTARYSTSNTQLNFDTAGAGITWNYSSLVANGQGIDSFEPALLINPAYALYFSFNTDYGVPNNNLNFGFVSLTNGYDFYKTSTSDLQINGIGAEYSSIPLAANYTTPDKVYQFPLSYGRIDTSAYDVTIDIPGTATIHEIGTRINTVDGWGTVITPFDTFQCIRLKSVTTEEDSITITLLGFTIGVPKNTTTYKWLANGVIIPVLEVSGNESPFGNTFQATSIQFRDNVRFIPPQFNLTINFTASATTCTTADTVTITPRVRPFNAQNTASYAYSITPGTYNYVSGTDSTSSNPAVNFTAPGLYTVSLFASAPAGGSVPATADTTKIDYINVTFPAGIQELPAANIIQVYPIPANDHLVCQLNGDAAKQATLQLLDLTGKILYSITTAQGGEVTIPTAQLPAGDYLLRATPAGGSSYAQKVSVVH